jgi:heat shock protein HtpX
MRNYLKTAVLMAALMGLALAVGEWLGGAQGMLWAGGLTLVMNFVSYWFSDRIALAMNGARPLDPNEVPWLQRMLERLCQQAGLPVPKLYIIPSPAPNAFATGRNPEHAAVAVTQGILGLLQPEELEGVLAHELSHVKNRDTLISTVAASMAGLITMGVRMLFWFGGAFAGGRGGDRDDRPNALVQLGLLLVAPLAATLLQLAISRSREYGADASGAALTKDPDALANALSRLEEGVTRMPDDRAPATAPLFIVNPLSGSGVLGLFSTHPPLEERIKRLRQMARGGAGA